MNVVICTHMLQVLPLSPQFLFIENGQSRVRDIAAFHSAVEHDSSKDYLSRDTSLMSIYGLWRHGNQKDRVGNSMQDLRLSVRGWRLGSMVRQGGLSTNKDLANWLALYVAEN